MKKAQDYECVGQFAQAQHSYQLALQFVHVDSKNRTKLLQRIDKMAQCIREVQGRATHPVIDPPMVGARALSTLTVLDTNTLRGPSSKLGDLKRKFPLLAHLAPVPPEDKENTPTDTTDDPQEKIHCRRLQHKKKRTCVDSDPETLDTPVLTEQTRGSARSSQGDMGAVYLSVFGGCMDASKEHWKNVIEHELLDVLNFGTEKMVRALAGIGAKRCQRILEERTSDGPYAKVAPCEQGRAF